MLRLIKPHISSVLSAKPCTASISYMETHQPSRQILLDSSVFQVQYKIHTKLTCQLGTTAQQRVNLPGCAPLSLWPTTCLYIFTQNHSSWSVSNILGSSCPLPQNFTKKQKDKAKLWKLAKPHFLLFSAYLRHNLIAQV